MPQNKEHPAWVLYDEIFDIRLNICYLQWEQRRLKRIHFYMEVFLAIFTSSTVAGFWFWGTLWGGYAWKIIGAIVAILAVLKPILKTADRIRKTTELLTDARAINHELNTICVLTRQSQEYKEEFKERLIKAMEYKGEFIKNYKERTANKKVVDQCDKRVRKDFPPEDFYIPEKKT